MGYLIPDLNSTIMSETHLGDELQVTNTVFHYVALNNHTKCRVEEFFNLSFTFSLYP